MQQTNFTIFSERGKEIHTDGTYTDDFITSKEECFKWLEDNKDAVGYKHVFDDTPEREEELRLHAIERLNEFWEKYPNGVIYFG
jgi:hypothetical protein